MKHRQLLRDPEKMIFFLQRQRKGFEISHHIHGQSEAKTKSEAFSTVLSWSQRRLYKFAAQLITSSVVIGQSSPNLFGLGFAIKYILAKFATKYENEYGNETIVSRWKKLYSGQAFAVSETSWLFFAI